MRPWMRYTLAVIAGAIAAVLCVAAVESLGHALYAPPADLDIADPQAMAAYLQSMPAGAFLFVLLAWVIGTVVGGLVACMLARTRPQLFALVIGGLMLLGAFANFAMIPHPTWFMVAAVIAIPAAAVLAGRLGARWRRAEATPAPTIH